jgi:hypothetical protein
MIGKVLMTNAVDEIQVDIEQAREVVAESEALNRLFKNTDFKKLILEGYFKDEAARLVELKAAPQMQGEAQQKMLLAAIDSIGGLQQHFNKIWVMGEQAEQAIEQSQIELNELTEEEGEA